jgi:predicted RNase H-like nuclease (RuvC/YqgF family)
MKTNYERISQQFQDADSDEKKISILQEWIAHLEEDKAESYGQVLDLKRQFSQLADAAAILHGEMDSVDVAKAALWAEVQNAKKYLSLNA